MRSQRLLKKRELTTLSRPPRTKIAPPRRPRLSPVELPSVKVRFWTVSCGWSWFWQWEVVQTCAWSQVFMYRMRRLRPAAQRHQAAAVDDDLRALSLKTFAVAPS